MILDKAVISVAQVLQQLSTTVDSEMAPNFVQATAAIKEHFEYLDLDGGEDEMVRLTKVLAVVSDIAVWPAIAVAVHPADVPELYTACKKLLEKILTDRIGLRRFYGNFERLLEQSVEEEMEFARTRCEWMNAVPSEMFHRETCAMLDAIWGAYEEDVRDAQSSFDSQEQAAVARSAYLLKLPFLLEAEIQFAMYMADN